MKLILISVLCLSFSSAALARIITKTFSTSVHTQEYSTKSEAIQLSLDLENNIMNSNVGQVSDSTRMNCTVYPYKPKFIRGKVTIQESFINGIASYQGTIFFKYSCKVRETRH